MDGCVVGWGRPDGGRQLLEAIDDSYLRNRRTVHDCKPARLHRAPTHRLARPQARVDCMDLAIAGCESLGAADDA